jgi:hypothetical protein
MCPLTANSGLAAVVLPLGLGATAQAGTTTNLIAANGVHQNLIAANLIAANKLAANLIAANLIAANLIAANKLAGNKLAAVSKTVPTGKGAVDDIVGIELPDGTG